MWTETRVAVACILLCATTIAWPAPSGSSAGGASDIRIGLALLCTGDTPQSSRVEAPITESMVGRDVEPTGASTLCIVRDTRIDLPVKAIDAREDKWKVWRVEIAFAPKDEAAFNTIMQESAGGKLVLLRSENAVLQFEILRAARQQTLVLRGFDLDDAEAIRKAIVDGA